MSVSPRPRCHWSARVVRVLLVAFALTAVPIVASAQGTITGTVTSAATNLPIGSVYAVWCSSTSACTSALTNASGVYSVTVPAGTYFGYTLVPNTYINEIWDNIPCDIDCNSSTAVLTGTAVQVTNGATTANRNFALAVGGTITGVVRNEATAGIANVYVAAIAMTTRGVAQIKYSVTNAFGMYSIDQLPTRTYYLMTLSATPYINEIFDNIPCAGGCSSTTALTGTPVPVTAGATSANRNFALALGGSILGTVRNAATATPLANVTIQAYLRTSSNQLISGGASTTDATGAYSIDGLMPGSYIVAAQNATAIGFVNEVFDDIKCLASCSSADLFRGTPVPVTAGSVTSGRDFALDAGGQVTGTVKTAGGTAVAGWGVYLYVQNGTTLSFAAAVGTDATGAFTIRGLQTGRYFAATSGSSQNLLDEIYDNVPLSCTVSCLSAQTIMSLGKPIEVTIGATTAGINFALDTGGRLTGSVMATTPAANVRVNLVTRVAGALASFSTTTNATGAFTFERLGTGTYYASTDSSTHVDQIYNGLPCLGSCTNTSVIGTPIAVSAGATTTDINFALAQGGVISGTVRAADTLQPLVGVSVSAYSMGISNTAFSFGSATTDAAGKYQIAGLPAGTYYLLTSGANTRGYSNQIYSAVACASNCNPSVAMTTGTPVALSGGGLVTGRDFSLPLGGSISGTVINAATGGPVETGGVSIYARVGSAALFASSASLNALGGYLVTGLPPGTYYAATSVAAYNNRIYDGRDCRITCPAFDVITLGTPITVTAGATTPARNFAITPLSLAAAVPAEPIGLTVTVTGGTAVFSWFAPSTTTGGTVSSYLLEIGFSPGATVTTRASTSTTFSLPGIPAGRYFARVRGVNGNGSGAPSNEVDFAVGPSGLGVPSPPGGLVAYMVGTKLYATWSAPTTGGPASGYLIEAGTASGLANIATLPMGSGTVFTYDPVPTGFYFLRVRATNASGASAPSNEVLLVVGGASSPPDAPTNLGAAADAARTVTVGWTPPRGGAASYILEAGTALGLSNIATINTGNANTSISFPNVPPGTYYIRIRALNSFGASLATSDVTLVVR